MPKFINRNKHAVYLSGPDGKNVRIQSGQEITLSDYFERYVVRGYISKVEQPQPAAQVTRQPKVSIQTPKTPQSRILNRQIIKLNNKKPPRQVQIDNRSKQKIVGRKLNEDATKVLIEKLKNTKYPISNNIGVGILSYNRLESLARLINSIIKYTDLNKTTVIVSDDNSTDPDIIKYLDNLVVTNKIIVLRNNQNIGVAGNTNRLLQCLSRFEYGLLLNDDVEIINHGWDTHYKDAMVMTGLHCMCYQQEGVYGQTRTQTTTINSTNLVKTREKPHGAVLAYTNNGFTKVGYFDERFEQYGMEHVEWCDRYFKLGLQPKYHYDTLNSPNFFVIHNEQTSIPNKNTFLHKNRQLYKEINNTTYVDYTPKSAVTGISFVVPARNFNRNEAIGTVINNIRAQRYPKIDITLVEHDTELKVITSNIKHVLIPSNGVPFNKSKAFNLGVSLSKSSIIVLHDADLLAPDNYVSEFMRIMESNDACHLGARVIYLTEEDTKKVIASKELHNDAKASHTVGYFEGGSIVCRRDTYFKMGGFCEQFEGYGVEDCEFYNRLSSNCKWNDNRTLDFVHLHHGRTPTWVTEHKKNKALGEHIFALPMEQRIQMNKIELEKNGYS